MTLEGKRQNSLLHFTDVKAQRKLLLTNKEKKGPEKSLVSLNAAAKSPRVPFTICWANICFFVFLCCVLFFLISNATPDIPRYKFFTFRWWACAGNRQFLI